MSWGGNIRTLTNLCCFCIVLFGAPASAKVAAVPLEELVTGSDEIVVATVTEVSSESTSGPRTYASAVVARTIKGSLQGSFNFLASPTWTCDISDAVKGETVLLFLKQQSDHSFIIQHSGRGRMPLRVVGGRTYVTLWNDVRLPGDAPTVAGPDPRYDFIVSVELSYMKAMILKHKDRKAATQQAVTTDRSKMGAG